MFDTLLARQAFFLHKEALFMKQCIKKEREEKRVRYLVKALKGLIQPKRYYLGD